MDDLLEQTFSHYRVTSRLGQGGMGVVYRAHDDRLDRDLALKILPCDLMKDESARARLLNEARTNSGLSHPHIAHVYDVGEDRGHMFFAMELIEGKALKELIPRGGLPLSTACRYGGQIARALAYAHRQGVIHRDLKTTNIMITPDGTAKVLDFGLAKKVREEVGKGQDLSLTATGTILGTPNYMPPEVLLGGAADERSDIWSLGVVLYEMVSGKLPFDGSSMAELAGAIMNEPPNPLSGRVPTGIQLVIARCLAKEPTQRYRSASEVAAALEALDPSGIRRGMPAGGAWRTWALGAGVLAIGAVAVWLAVHTADIQKRLAGGGKERATAADRGAGAPLHIGSLAVLPLANLSGDPAQEFFADGMTDELITNLAPIRSLKVISRTSVMPFKKTDKSLKEIAVALDVDAIVEGSVLRAGNKVRITAQLIQAAQDRHLWAKSYEREVKDVIALQSEVARDIAGEIQLQLSPQEHAMMMKPRRPVNPEAYELYLRGRYEWSKVSPEGSTQAIAYYKKAAALDPKDPRYASGIADTYLLQVQVLNMLPEKQGMALVKEYARRALALDDSSAEAHASMAIATLFGDWNWREAEHHVQDALQLNPGYSTGHLVDALLLVTQGRFNEAIEQNQRALQLDPLSLIVNWHMAAIYFYARRYDDAIAAAKHTMELYPMSPLPHGALAMSYEQTGRFQEMMDVMEKAMPPGVHEETRAFFPRLRAAYAKDGPAGYWRETLAIQLEGQQRMRVYSRDYARLAMLYLRAGRKEEAIQELQRGFQDHSGDMIFMRVMPCFDDLHGDPRFEALMKRVGAPTA